jgi:hypothetical protein
MFLILALLSLFNTPPQLSAMEYLVFPDRGGFSIITPDSIYHTVDGKYFDRRKHYFQAEIYRMEPVPSVGSAQYFVATGGGVVYKYANDTLVRIDQSYRWRSRFGASLVAVEDKVYSFGGYGEFTFYNDLLLFEEENREWIEIPVSEPRPSRKSSTLIQYDTLSQSIFIALGGDSFYKNKRSNIRAFYDIGRYDLIEGFHEPYGNLDLLKPYLDDAEVKFWAHFHQYKLPIYFSNKYFFSFDFAKGTMYEHSEVNHQILESFSRILAYNQQSNTFLLGSDLPTNARFHVINEADFLGRHYIEHDISVKEGILWWQFSLAGALLSILALLFTGKTVSLIDLIQQHSKKLKAKLSDEDFVVLQKIIECYPNTIDYPELQNSFERDLSYESRIKKLRNTIKTIDEEIQQTLGLRKSVFVIDKGREDKRVKVIRIKEETIKRSKLRSLWPF